MEPWIQVFVEEKETTNTHANTMRANMEGIWEHTCIDQKLSTEQSWKGYFAKISNQKWVCPRSRHRQDTEQTFRPYLCRDQEDR